MTTFGEGDCYLIGLIRKDVRANNLRRRRTPIDRWLQIRHFLDGVRRGPGRNGHSNFSCSSRGISALATSSTQELTVWWEYFVQWHGRHLAPELVQLGDSPRIWPTLSVMTVTAPSPAMAVRGALVALRRRQL